MKAVAEKAAALFAAMITCIWNVQAQPYTLTDDTFSAPTGLQSPTRRARPNGLGVDIDKGWNSSAVRTGQGGDDNPPLNGALATNVPSSGDATVDWNDLHQRIDGFGASSAWNGSWTTSEADLLFSTKTNLTYQSGVYNGVGLSLLRNHIAFVNTTSSNAVPTTVETSIMKLAQARGARVWSSPWTPPSGFKSVHDIYDTGVATGAGVNGGSFLGKGNNPTNLNYASQLANYVASMKKTYGVDLYAISIQNEPDAVVTNYEACQWTGAQIHDFVTNLSNALTSKGVSATKIIIPESQNWSFNTALYAPTLADSNTAGVVSIIADHDYVADNAVGDQSTPIQLATSGKTLWETEVALLSGSDSSITNGIYYAQRIHAYLTKAQANAYHYWWLVAMDSGNQGLLDTNAAPTKRLFAFGQFSRFVRPNFYRIGVTATGSPLVSAFKDSASPAFAIVAVNTNAVSDIVETFRLTNFSAGAVTPWITSASLSLAPQPPIGVTNNSFAFTLPAMSIVTFAGQDDAAISPTIGPVSLSPGQIHLAVNGPNGPNYTLQTSTNLIDWQALVTSNSPVTPFTFTDTNDTQQTKFYRIQIGQ